MFAKKAWMLSGCGREDLWHRTPSSILLLYMKWKIEQARTALRNNQYFAATEEHALSSLLNDQVGAHW